MRYRRPLTLQLCWFDGASARVGDLARFLYGFFHRPVGADPVLQPGVEIPVEYGRRLADLLRPAPGAGDGVRVIALLLDRAAFRSSAVREVVAAALARWPTATADTVLVPIAVHRAWLAELGGLAGIDACVRDDPALCWRLAVELGVVIGRALARPGLGGEPPRPQVFVSHALADGASLATDLVGHLTTRTQMRVWFDVSDVHRGEALAPQLASAAGNGVFLAVRTSAYFASPLCRVEMLCAKSAGIPIVTILDASDEVWTSAHSGNHGTLRWSQGREWEVVARCVQAWVHSLYFHAHATAALQQVGLPATTEIVTHRPELLDLVDGAGHGLRLVIHPDPPMTEPEVRPLRAISPGLRLLTPTTLFGRVLLAADPEPPLAGIAVAFSLSIGEEVPAIQEEHQPPGSPTADGITQSHVDDVVFAVGLATIHNGAVMAYGGDFRQQGGYAVMLASMVGSWRRIGAAASAQLRCFVPGVGADDREDEAEDLVFDPIEVPLPAGAEEFDEEVQFAVWHLAMRDRAATTCAGRVIVGGKTRPQGQPHDGGYVGPWPGILEEAWRTLAAGQALYLLGGFGGGARQLATMLISGVVPPELTRAHPVPATLSDLRRRVDRARVELVHTGSLDARTAMKVNDELLDIEGMARALLACWQGNTWGNGLSRDENLRLMTSIDRTEISYLVLHGLRRRRAAMPAAAPRGYKVTLYAGDIAAVPQVKGYAVGVTPGVPARGAAAALDDRLGGRLRGLAWTNDERVADLLVEDGALAGRYVLVGRIPLPAPDAAASEVAATVQAIAQRAAGLGLDSLACPPIGATLGIGPTAAAAGFLAALDGAGWRGSKVVLCETDPASYQALRAAYQEEAVELAAGPVLQVRRNVMLHIQARGPTDDRPEGAIEVTMLDGGDAKGAAPFHHAALELPTWDATRERYLAFDRITQMGRVLRELALPAPMRAPFAREPAPTLVVVTDTDAAGLPWEMICDDADRPIALRSGVVRVMAMSGASPPVSHRRSHVSVLLVVNPTGLQGGEPELANAEAEAEAVTRALGRRPDVVVRRVRPAIATVQDELRQGEHDVLHYIGHAGFDPARPAEAGLHLTDGVFQTRHLVEAVPPRLVLLSACESGRVRGAWASPPPASGQPLAAAFLQAGVNALVGTFFAVSDESARVFSTMVQGALVDGMRLGEAVRAARTKLYDSRSLDWPNFQLFGDDELVL